MTDYNENQNRAITAPLAHMAINAAAGTGKTSTLAARIQYLQAELDLLPNSIMAISFSRTARSRLIEKLKELCKKTKFGSPVPTYTFHGLSFRILRIAAGMGETWLKPGFEIIESLSRGNNPIFRRHSSLLNGVFKQLDSEIAWEACMKAIDSLRQGSDEMEPCFAPEDLDSNVLVEVDIGQNTLIRLKSAEVLTVWRRYENMLKQYNIIDYWGLIVEAVNILSQPETETRKRVRENLRAIVVDEYQDTSRAQEKLLFALAGNDIPVNVVGDIDQTIYTFNGSSASNMANFLSMAAQTDISVLTSISMTENYRSATPILELANRIRKELTDDRKLLPASDLSDKNIALYRKRNFPVRLVYAPKLELAADFVAKEIDRLVNDEEIDSIAVLVRKDSEYSPQARAVREALDLFEIKNDVMSTQTQKDRHDHFQFLYSLFQDPEHYGKSLSDLISTDLKITLPSSMTNEQFHSYIHEALDSGASYCYEAADFLFDNMTTEDSDEQGNCHIKIGTVHSAKGEEFRVVFLLYLGDRSFPHGSQPDLDEERRLLYVGITRAQERLYVIGRPGIHSESFFDNCKGPNTSYLEYSVLGGKANDEKETRFDTEIAASIEQARSVQQAREKEERENLWKLFEEEY
ncbi:ATP-dependent helicase [Paenibacillus apiarius]|uniref:ATP-dependent helicase n=1 Tax=Paenibacillus apiarius TaxID=46240 RepID=UPI00197E7D2F|nr:ATP-dependent helicase [Paenibacillus apiarius]MBN3525171.1 ATP-dependent helicase [Paenibacillus apiarius]